MNNSLTLVGHVGRAPETKVFSDTGNQLVKFSVAVKEYSANTDQPKTLWFDVDAWNGLAERVLKTVSKGREIVINGRLSLNSFTKEVDGVKIEVTKPVIKLTSFYLCGAKPKEEAAQPQEPAPKVIQLAAANA